MTAAKKAQIGDLLRVPAHLLFPQRGGKWNRHDFSSAQVIKVGKGRSGGAMVMVRFYDEFRYTPGDPVRIECFYLDNCAKTDLDWQEHHWTRCPDITQEHIDREKKRVTATPQPTGINDRYRFRCFMLHIGMIGSEYATARTRLMRDLSGNSGWLAGPPPKAEAPAEEAPLAEDIPPAPGQEADAPGETDTTEEIADEQHDD